MANLFLNPRLSILSAALLLSLFCLPAPKAAAASVWSRTCEAALTFISGRIEMDAPVLIDMTDEQFLAQVLKLVEFKVGPNPDILFRQPQNRKNIISRVIKGLTPYRFRSFKEIPEATGTRLLMRQLELMPEAIYPNQRFFLVFRTGRPKAIGLIQAWVTKGNDQYMPSFVTNCRAYVIGDNALRAAGFKRKYFSEFWL